MKKPMHFVGQPFYYNCRDCEKELWTERERKAGLCLVCLEKRVQAVLQPKMIITVRAPWHNAQSN
jgi:hypothetical protein